MKILLLTIMNISYYLQRSPPRNCFAPCNNDYKPVCGASGKTFRNMCHLTCNSTDELKH